MPDASGILYEETLQILINMIIVKLQKTKNQYLRTEGNCANCGIQVWESELTLDDCYNVWAGRCPDCNAINLLSMNHGLRGYHSGKMFLVLPTNEEVESNPDLPKDCPTQGSKGPANWHGSPLGEAMHKLMKE